MDSESPDRSSQIAMEGDLVAAGEKLLAIPSSSSTDELLLLLERAEDLLAQVWQKPLRSTSFALLPAMKALITDEILHHDDLNVQLVVASCFNELTRITAPDVPYPDELMKDFFKLVMIAFEQLPSESGPNYSRALQIVETVAQVRASLMLLDIEADDLVVEMFQLFLNNIRSTHPAKVFKNMETIMSLVIEESDAVSIELLRPLLDSVKMENKKTSPISWELGKKVLENSAAKLPQYLKEAVKAMNLDLDDYADIVTSIYNDTSNGENMVSKDVATTVGEGSKAGDEDSTQETNDGDETKLDDENPSETAKGRHQSGTDSRIIQRRRGRKPSSVIRPEEGYVHAWARRGKCSDEMSSDGYNEEKKDLGHSSKKKNDSASEVSRKKGPPKKKESLVDTHNELEFSSTLKKKILQSKAKKKGQNAQKKTGERAVSGSSDISETLAEGKDVEKIEELRRSTLAKGKHLKKEKEKKSKKSQVDYGEELVNLRIQVWWPMDETFYTGTVQAFDPETKKHRVLYDDDEIEVLNLHEERWEVVGDKRLLLKQEANHPSPPKEPLKTQEKASKRKAGHLRKQLAPSSSKRPKSENHSVKDNSAPDVIHVNDETDNEMCETAKDDGENHPHKEGSGTLKKKIESGPHIREGVTED